MNPVLLHLQHRLIQERKPEDVPRRQENNVNIVLCRPVIKLHSWFSEAFDVGFDDHVAADDPVGEVIVDGGMGRQWWEVGFKTVGCVIESLVQLCLDNLSDNSLRYNIFFQPVEYTLLIFIEIHF